MSLVRGLSIATIPTEDVHPPGGSGHRPVSSIAVHRVCSIHLW